MSYASVATMTSQLRGTAELLTFFSTNNQMEMFVKDQEGQMGTIIQTIVKVARQMITLVQTLML